MKKETDDALSDFGAKYGPYAPYIFLGVTLVVLLVMVIINYPQIQEDRAREYDSAIQSLTETICAEPQPGDYRLNESAQDIYGASQDAYAYWKSPDTGTWQPLDQHGDPIAEGARSPITPADTNPVECG